MRFGQIYYEDEISAVPSLLDITGLRPALSKHTRNAIPLLYSASLLLSQETVSVVGNFYTFLTITHSISLLNNVPKRGHNSRYCSS